MNFIDCIALISNDLLLNQTEIKDVEKNANGQNFDIILQNLLNNENISIDKNTTKINTNVLFDINKINFNFNENDLKNELNFSKITKKIEKIINDIDCIINKNTKKEKNIDLDIIEILLSSVINNNPSKVYSTLKENKENILLLDNCKEEIEEAERFLENFKDEIKNDFNLSDKTLNENLEKILKEINKNNQKDFLVDKKENVHEKPKEKNDEHIQKKDNKISLDNNPLTENTETIIKKNENIIEKKEIIKAFEYDENDIIKQIVKNIKVSFKDNISSVEMHLHPASLGSVKINVSIKNGEKSAQFIVQNESVKKIVEIQMVELNNVLEEKGQKIKEIEIVVSDYNLENDLNENKNQKHNHQKHKKRNVAFFKEKQNEKFLNELKEINGNNIEFFA